MKILFVGGTGTISTACTSLAAERGIELLLLDRGRRQVDLPAGVERFLIPDKLHIVWFHQNHNLYR